MKEKYAVFNLIVGYQFVKKGHNPPTFLSTVHTIHTVKV
jgi:hypothetical protein